MKINEKPILPWSAPQPKRAPALSDALDLCVLSDGGDLPDYAKLGVVQTARLFRYSEVDEEAAVFLGVNSDFVQALGLIDGAVTVYDGYQMLRDGCHSGLKRELLGGVARIALGAAGALPGLGGAVGEGLLGIYQTAEGIHAKDHENTVAGITQFGASVGMGLLSEGIGGWIGPALILGSGMGRAVALHQIRRRDEAA